MQTMIHQLLETAKTKPGGIASLLDGLTPREAMAILDDWSLWALPYQQMPSGEWRRWIIRAGRGVGKNYGASKTVHQIAKDKSKIGNGTIGIIGRTYTDVRDNCVEGPSGILATAPSYFKPVWMPGKGTIYWPNGVRGRVFSADSIDSVRGSNFSFVWADEIAFWEDGESAWWTQIEPALRQGWARAMITTTPKPLKFLMALEKMPNTVVTTAKTYDNPFLAKEALQAFRAYYEGTRIGKQELEGEYLEDIKGALVDYKVIESIRVNSHAPLKRIVVSIDPAITSHSGSDETGIIVFGVDANGTGYVLEDASGVYSPSEWATKAVSLYKKYKADRIIAEVNQGGDMVENTLRAVDRSIPYSSVRATRGKMLRAEPVGALYERGLIKHVGIYHELEKQLSTWIPGSAKSPDRLDALVHASTYLQLSDSDRPVGPITAYL
jgi:phage terminase large subunit-like protein